MIYVMKTRNWKRCERSSLHGISSTGTACARLYRFILFRRVRLGFPVIQRHGMARRFRIAGIRRSGGNKRSYGTKVVPDAPRDPVGRIGTWVMKMGGPGKRLRRSPPEFPFLIWANYFSLRQKFAGLYRPPSPDASPRGQSRRSRAWATWSCPRKCCRERPHSPKGSPLR